MNKKRTGAFFLSPSASSRSFLYDRNELRGRGFAAQCNFLQFQRKLRPENSLGWPPAGPSNLASSTNLQKFPLFRVDALLFFF
jgi:hypothetical protein